MTINEGQLENFKKVVSTMTALCDSEPGTLGYEFFLSADQKHCRLQETYVDGDAMLAHLAGPVITEHVPKLAAFCKNDRFEIYGDPGPKVAEIASKLGAQIFTYWTGCPADHSGRLLNHRLSGTPPAGTSLLLVEIDRLVLVARDAGADLRGGPSLLGL